MASKEAAKAEPKAAEPEFYAFEFNLPKDKIGEKTTNPQVKSKVGEAFLGYGAFTECQVVGQAGNDRTVIVFFARLFEKGQPTWNALKKNEKATVKVYDEDVELRLSGAKPSGGGATTGTSSRPKKEAAKKAGGRGAPRGGDRKEGGDRKDGAAPAGKDGAAAGKDGDAKKEGERPKRPKRPQEEKKTDLQRGRANIGGKLGPVSKIRLARQAKEARDKENAARIARGEEPLEDEKKKGKHDDDDDKPAAPAKGAKKEAGKAAGKKEGGKAEAPKAAAKKK